MNYEPGDLVLVKFPFSEPNKSHKLAPLYKGPFKILQKINNLNYKINLTLNNKITEDVIHIRRLKPYIQKKKIITILILQNELQSQYFYFMQSNLLSN